MPNTSAIECDTLGTPRKHTVLFLLGNRIFKRPLTVFQNVTILLDPYVCIDHDKKIHIAEVTLVELLKISESGYSDFLFGL